MSLDTLKAIVGRAALIWIPVALVITALTCIVYASVQQVVRLGADDTLIAIAEDSATRLDSGVDPRSLVPPAVVDIGRSLSPYIMVFDGQGKLVASSATLHGQTPPVPAGVFDAARRQGEDRVTWQPESGVRSAIVVVPSRNGYVLAGRSIRLVEQREDTLGQLAFALWVVTLGGMAVVAIVLGWLSLAAGWLTPPGHSGAPGVTESGAARRPGSPDGARWSGRRDRGETPPSTTSA